MDLNMMMRDQARLGLQTQLDTAVTNGDTAAATKIADDIAKLAVSTAPKALAYGDVEIKAQLDKQPWFGIDPKKSARVIELGKHMDPKKFPTAEAFTAALVAAVDAETAPAAGAPKGDDDGDDDGESEEEDEDAEKPAAKKTRKTDAPGEADAGSRSAPRRTSGPWTKMTDAPADIQKEVKRSMDKLLSSSASKEAKEKFITRALESHHAAFVRSKGKK